MPIVLVLLLICLSIVAGITNGTRSDTQERFGQQANAIATQMTWYHMSALRQCAKPAICSPGTINVPQPTNAGSLVYSNNFVSATDGTQVVTTWVTGSRFAGPQFGMSGLVASSLKLQSVQTQTTGTTPTYAQSAYVGSWDAATQSLGGTNIYYYSGTNGQTTVPVSQGFGGLTLVNGAPMLVTPLSPATPSTTSATP